MTIAQGRCNLSQFIRKKEMESDVKVGDPIKVVEEKKKETKKVPVYFGSTDIRYRHLESNNQEFVEQVVEEKSQPIETDTEQAVEVTQVSEEESVEALEKPVEVSEIQVEDHKMTVEMSVVESASPIPVPDVISALNDPLCGSGGATPPGSDYSSSPVKSESAVSSKSSCEVCSCEFAVPVPRRATRLEAMASCVEGELKASVESARASRRKRGRVVKGRKGRDGVEAGET